jgi:signal transduction histidine kinase
VVETVIGAGSSPGPGDSRAHAASGEPSPVMTPMGPGTPVLGAFDVARLQRIVDVVADGITVQAPDGHLVYANEAAARACGFASPSELLGAARDQILARFELLDDEGRPLPASELPGASVLRGDPAHDRVVGFRILATGESRWSIVSAVPLLDAEGKLEFAVNAFHDITGRKRAEDERDRERSRLAATLSQRLADEARLAELIRSERARAAELNAIIRAIGEGIVVVDRDGLVTLANRTARRMLGSFEGVDLDAIFVRFERPSDLRSRLGGGPVQARLAGDEGRWLEVAAYPVDEAEASGSGGMILVLRDVTAARERDQARDAFIGMLSHELRTPITTIYAGSKLLARDGRLSAETRQEIFEDIHGEAERLHRLVEDVVALTRFGEGALQIGSEPVLLQRVLPAVVRSEEGRWPGGKFQLRLESDLPPVSGDATYVEQVVRNLLANAMKYGGPGSTATIKADWTDGEVIVRVLDEGPGFPADEADHLFELYYRSPVVARKISGSGIGLFVCARLIDAMGGRVWARNRPDRGAEFGFALRTMDEDR